MAVSISERAVLEVKRIIEEQNMPDATALRVGVKGGGCSGFSYTLGFDDRPEETANARGRRAGAPGRLAATSCSRRISRSYLSRRSRAG